MTSTMVGVSRTTRSTVARSSPLMARRNSTSLNTDAVAIASLDRDCERARAAMRIDFDRERRQALGEAHALLQRFLDFLVIERVRRTVEQAPAIGDRDAAPGLQQLQHACRTALARGD